MDIVVQKYGGSSLEDISKIQAIANKIHQKKLDGYSMVIVVSAMGKTTNNLISMANSICDNPCGRELDMLMSTGEQISSALLSIALKKLGQDSISLTGFQAGIHTKGMHTKNKIKDIKIEKVKSYLEDGKVVVVTGFQGVNERGDITTLGRGGSDTTAVALASKLNCNCEIYTDVDGIYSIDPKIYPTATKLEYISYEEMLEMASLGATVMEPRAVEIGQKYNVPIYVALNTGQYKGTYIKEFDANMEEKIITGLTTSDEDLMVTINQVPYNTKNVSNIFQFLSDKDINIDMISQTAPANNHVNISFTAPKSDICVIRKILTQLKESLPDITIQLDEDITKISVIGLGMRNQSGVAAKMFKIFADNDIAFKQVTTSEIRISYTINTVDKDKAIVSIANAFNL